MDKKKYSDIQYLIDDLKEAVDKIENMKISKSVIDVDMEDLKPVWTYPDKKIKVYRLNNIFEAIAIGKNRGNFCTAIDYKNGDNQFYNYVYYNNNESGKNELVKGKNAFEQTSTLYHILVNDNLFLLDKRTDGTYLYSDSSGKDILFDSYSDMINNINGRFNDNTRKTEEGIYAVTFLKYIPESIFKFVKHKVSKEELQEVPHLVWFALGDPLEYPEITPIDNFLIISFMSKKIDILEKRLKDFFSSYNNEISKMKVMEHIIRYFYNRFIYNLDIREENYKKYKKYAVDGFKENIPKVKNIIIKSFGEENLIKCIEYILNNNKSIPKYFNVIIIDIFEVLLKNNMKLSKKLYNYIQNNRDFITYLDDIQNFFYKYGIPIYRLSNVVQSWTMFNFLFQPYITV